MEQCECHAYVEVPRTIEALYARGAAAERIGRTLERLASDDEKWMSG